MSASVDDTLWHPPATFIDVSIARSREAIKFDSSSNVKKMKREDTSGTKESFAASKTNSSLFSPCGLDSRDQAVGRVMHIDFIIMMPFYIYTVKALATAWEVLNEAAGLFISVRIWRCINRLTV